MFWILLLETVIIALIIRRLHILSLEQEMVFEPPTVVATPTKVRPPDYISPMGTKFWYNKKSLEMMEMANGDIWAYVGEKVITPPRVQKEIDKWIKNLKETFSPSKTWQQ